MFNQFSKFKKWLIQQNKSHLDLQGFKTMSKFDVVKINSEKCFGIRKSKFHTNISEGKADSRRKFEPWMCKNNGAALREKVPNWHAWPSFLW